jgi:hypothetical protein
MNTGNGSLAWNEEKGYHDMNNPWPVPHVDLHEDDNEGNEMDNVSLPQGDGYYYYSRKGWANRARVEVIRGKKGLFVRLRDDAIPIPLDNFPEDCHWILTNPGELGIETYGWSTGAMEREKTLREISWETKLHHFDNQLDAICEKYSGWKRLLTVFLLIIKYIDYNQRN